LLIHRYDELTQKLEWQQHKGTKRNIPFLQQQQQLQRGKIESGNGKDGEASGVLLCCLFPFTASAVPYQFRLFSNLLQQIRLLSIDVGLQGNSF
jgi:hypothetical protein